MFSLGRVPPPMPMLPPDMFETEADWKAHCAKYQEAWDDMRRENDRRFKIENRMIIIFGVMFSIGVPLSLWAMSMTFLNAIVANQ
jgi:hypothetical protein